MFLALMLTIILLPMVGLAIDGTMLFIVKAKLSAAVDGGAIAAARSLSAGLTMDAQRAAAIQTATEFVQANFPAGYWGASSPVFDPPIQVVEDMTTSIKRRTVEISARVTVPLLFMRVIGKDSATVAAYGKAARRDVRMVLVLDRSYSMIGAIGDLKLAAANFVRMFAEGRDEVGLVVFGGSAIVAFPPRDPLNPSGGTGPANNFKTANPNVTSLIEAIQAGSNTGTAEALWLAYLELKKNPLPGALNLIVLFTDGLPNGITAFYNDPAGTLIKSPMAGGTCYYTIATSPGTEMIGWISQVSNFAMTGNTRGIYQLMNLTRDATHPDVMSWMSKPSERVLQPPPSQNCAYYTNQNNMKKDVMRIPSVDYYGNRADGTAYMQSGLYKSQLVPLDLNRVDSPYHIGLASWNLADAAAQRIRADDTLNPVIYTIGYAGGAEVPDPVLMKRIANVNDSENLSYDPTKPEGLYVMAPTQAQLAAAFGKVASEILRLTN